MRWDRFSQPVWSLARRVLAALHLARGKQLYARGRFAAAGAHVQRALTLHGPSFDAHLCLGKIYMRLSRYDRARREFALARYLDPGRFAAQGLPEDILLEMAQRFYQPLWSQKPPRDASTVGRGDARGMRSTPRIVDDFSSAAERERFRVLPPIHPSDIDEIDWSTLLEDSRDDR